MTDEMGGDDKVLCIPAADQRQDNLKELTDLPNLTLLEIAHFFSVYKDLEPGKSVEGAVGVGHAKAEMEIRASWERARGTPTRTSSPDHRRIHSAGRVVPSQTPGPGDSPRHCRLTPQDSVRHQRPTNTFPQAHPLPPSCGGRPTTKEVNAALPSSGGGGRRAEEGLILG